MKSIYYCIAMTSLNIALIILLLNDLFFCHSAEIIIINNIPSFLSHVTLMFKTYTNNE